MESRRNEGPFVTVDCPALSPELSTSMLFGHRKGAFTGAVADAIGGGAFRCSPPACTALTMDEAQLRANALVMARASPEPSAPP